MAARSIIVVAGIGNGSGIGGATARLFAKKGYNVALIARNPEHIKNLAKELTDTGAEAGAFPIDAYTYAETSRVFASIKSAWPSAEIRVTVWNAGDAFFKGFLEHSEEDVRKVIDTSVIGSFAFSKESIETFKDQELDKLGSRGTLIFTGATSAIRGNVFTSAFSASKFANRSLSQSLAKEFGKQNIHVSHAIIDGAVLTDRSTEQRTKANPDYLTDEDIRLDPNSIAQTYLHLTEQHRSSWAWEIDLRPAHEKW